MFTLIIFFKVRFWKCRRVAIGWRGLVKALHVRVISLLLLQHKQDSKHILNSTTKIFVPFRRCARRRQKQISTLWNSFCLLCLSVAHSTTQWIHMQIRIQSGTEWKALEFTYKLSDLALLGMKDPVNPASRSSSAGSFACVVALGTFARGKKNNNAGLCIRFVCGLMVPWTRRAWETLNHSFLKNYKSGTWE